VTKRSGSTASVAWKRVAGGLIGLLLLGGAVFVLHAELRQHSLAEILSELQSLPPLRVGLSLAVLVDAFLIRATLVPAFMRLAGRSNWWSPAWLRRWHLRYGIWENEPIAILDREFEVTK